MAIRNRLGNGGGWRRRAGVIALAAIVGSTVYGDNRSLREAVAGGESGRGSLGSAASAWIQAAENVASIGILYGTVLSRMEPGVRQSILAAVEGFREVCTGRAKPAISRCAARPLPSKKPPRCSRA